MWRVPYICFFIIVLCPSWYQTLLFCLPGAVLVFSLLWLVCRARFDRRLAEQTRIAREFHDNILQTIQGSKFVADVALEKPDDTAHMRVTLEKLSNWLGHATQEAQAALDSLPTPELERMTTESSHTLQKNLG